MATSVLFLKDFKLTWFVIWTPAPWEPAQKDREQLALHTKIVTRVARSWGNRWTNVEQFWTVSINKINKYKQKTRNNFKSQLSKYLETGLRSDTVCLRVFVWIWGKRSKKRPWEIGIKTENNLGNLGWCHIRTYNYFVNFSCMMIAVRACASALYFSSVLPTSQYSKIVVVSLNQTFQGNQTLTRPFFVPDSKWRETFQVN